jgi:hypothetical protein
MYLELIILPAAVAVAHRLVQELMLVAMAVAVLVLVQEQ